MTVSAFEVMAGEFVQELRKLVAGIVADIAARLAEHILLINSLRDEYCCLSIVLSIIV